MKAVVIRTNLVRKITNGRLGITLYPFILVVPEAKNELLAHEWIHIRQVERLGWIKFYWSYLVEYWKNRAKYADKNLAYRLISFEVEAYNQSKEVDLKNTEIWGYCDNQRNQ